MKGRIYSEKIKLSLLGFVLATTMVFSMDIIMNP